MSITKQEEIALELYCFSDAAELLSIYIEDAWDNLINREHGVTIVSAPVVTGAVRSLSLYAERLAHEVEKLKQSDIEGETTKAEATTP